MAGNVEVERAAREAEVSAIVKLLTLEHAEHLVSLLELQHCKNFHAAEYVALREELLASLVADLAAHQEAERSVLYARLSGHPKHGATLDAHAQDAQKLLRVANQLRTLPPTDAAYAHSLQQLTAMYQQHSRREETELFMKAQQVLDAKDETLRIEYLRAKARVQRAMLEP